MANSPFKGLKPKVLWNHFEALTRIPRCSGNESAAAQYVLDQAKAKAFDAQKDQAGNTVVRVPGTKGKEKKKPVVLQGHLDMVGEKDSTSGHDFAKDPIPVVKEGGFLKANGTTLGSDNGVGLAAALALMDDTEAVHGPLELLFTVDEETGLSGARALQAGFVTGKIMLNLDSEEEGSLYVGCAGGADTQVFLPLQRSPGAGERVRVLVKGLKGGHSGLDINTGRGNALKVLATFLDRLRRESDYFLSSFEGGDKHNAIPREASAEVLLPAGGKEKAEKSLAALRADLAACFGKTDPGVSIELGKAQGKETPLTREARDRFLDLVLAVPHGVLAMSQAVPGLVESSTNLAVVRLEEREALIHESSRSSVMPVIAMTQAGLMALARLGGARPVDKGGYPGWQPDMDSAVLKRAGAVYEKLNGRTPAVKAIHAGLECGIIGEKFGGMDMISFGPTIEWPHSPSERVQIDSVEKFYQFLKALLADLAG